MIGTKDHLLTWLGLLGLCVVSVSFRGGGFVLLGAAGLKCTLLGWRFMELRAAHWAWRVLVLGLVAALLGTLGFVVGLGA